MHILYVPYLLYFHQLETLNGGFHFSPISLFAISPISLRDLLCSKKFRALD